MSQEKVLRHRWSFYTFSGTFVALGALTLWHARLINAGQTSIEVDFFYLNRDTLQLNLSNNHHKSFITFRHISIGQKQKGLQNWEEFIETRTISVQSTIGISFLALWMAGKSFTYRPTLSKFKGGPVKKNTLYKDGHMVDFKFVPVHFVIGLWTFFQMIITLVLGTT